MATMANRSVECPVGSTSPTTLPVEESLRHYSQQFRPLLILDCEKGVLPAMKAVILAGGFGTRISEESGVRPKPMVEIGGKPILWHIMKIYSAYGINEFIVCLGYKGYMIKEYFAN